MPKTDPLKQKVFTTREPIYKKLTSKETIAAETKVNELLKRKDFESTALPANEGKLLVLFVHGFAASKYCWLDPDIGNMGWVKDYRNDPPPLDFGWHAIPPPLLFPVDWTMSPQIVPKGASEFLDHQNIEWATYSQKSAFGDIDVSVNELKDVLSTMKKIYGDRRIVIIAHSRGGLISKRYLDTTLDTPVEKLITFGTPFDGTFLSGIDTFRVPSKVFLNRVRTAKKLWDFSEERRIESISTKQMAPGSDFLRRLNDDGLRDDVEYINVAGTSAQIANIYVWRWDPASWYLRMGQSSQQYRERKKRKKAGEPPLNWFNLPKAPMLYNFNWVLKPTKVLQIYPRVGYREVLQGDGAVAVESALLPFKEVKQYLTPDNHIDMTCTKKGIDIMLKELKFSQNKL